MPTFEDMGLDGEFQQKFIDFLKTKGYPAESLSTSQSFVAKGANLQPDLVVLHPKTAAVLAVIELNRRPAPIEEIPHRYRFLNAYEPARRSAIFIVNESLNSPLQMEIIRLRPDGTVQAVPLETFPSYASLVAVATATLIEERVAEQRQTIDQFKIACWSLAGVAVALFILDVVCSTKTFRLLTTERMTIFGAAVALVVIPYAAKFKSPLFEWERLQLISKPESEEKKA